MDLSRRGFLGSILAASAAPFIVRASSLMAVKPLPAMQATGGVMNLWGGALNTGDVFLTPAQITRATLAILYEKLNTFDVEERGLPSTFARNLRIRRPHPFALVFGQ